MVEVIGVAGDWVQGEFKFVGETSPMQTRSLDPSKDPRLPTAPQVLWAMDGRWEGAYVPPSSRGRGSRAEPPQQREPISDWQLLSGKAPAGRAVVLGSEPRLEWFTLAL